MKCPLCDGTGEAVIGCAAKPTTKIGRILRESREAKGLSLRQVEILTGVSNPAISQIETGQIKSPAFHTIVSLCDVYGIEITKLTESKVQEDK